MMAIGRLSLLAGLGLVACSSSETGGTPATPGASGSAGQATTAAGTTSNPTAGAGGSTAMMMMTGGAATAGANTAGVTSTAGAGGAVIVGGTGGVATTGGGGSSAGGGDPLDTPPVHPLNITAAAAEHIHGTAGVDTRLPKMMGKLIVNVEVDSGGIYDYGMKHGFHVFGTSMFHCNIAQEQSTYTSEGRDFNGDCRLETFDGVDHDKSTAAGHAQVGPADSVSGKVAAALIQLEKDYPEEDWGFFLNADNTVRWSDVGITGYSHGASSAARWGKAVRLWRVVSRSGPRDNLCGTLYTGKTCMEDVISSWLDEVGKTPDERLYGLTGTTDSEYGDIIYAMERMHYIGALTDINTTAAPYNNSHRLHVNGLGHSNFISDNNDPKDKKYWPVMDYIWAPDPANIAYANSH